jgi:predicted MPP superfamily phosphohydrolase
MDDPGLFRIKTAVITAVIILLIDAYAFQALRTVLRGKSRTWRLGVFAAHWGLSFIAVGAALWNNLADPLNHYSLVREWLAGIVIPIYLSKLSALVVIAADDIRRLYLWVIRRLKPTQPPEDDGAQKIPRSVFLNKAAVIAGAVPFTAFTYGILSGAHDYRVIQRTIRLPNLPPALDGIRIGQFSDIHTGTLFNKIAIQGGIDLLLAQKPDLIFFTGDLVNYYAREARPYVPLFARVKAPLGVYAVTGNHDYGDYNWWPSPEARLADIRLIHTAYREMGYDLLLNENRVLTIAGESLAVIGVENWGYRRPQKYGDLTKALQGAEHARVKILLSHDPSHWNHEVKTSYPQIDITFSGHTHGFQCGVEVGDFRWSPAQYRFAQWADLYQQGEQYLYVNRGFGCVGYPGRIGMPPELTVVTLRRA